MLAASNSNSSQSKWLLNWHNNAPQQSLICFPSAGSGAYVYKAWAQSLAAKLNVYAVQIPGRENRIGEKPVAKLEELIHTLADELKPYLQPPFAFFGHSLGGIIAYELCRELRRRKEPIANHLFVSAVAAPDLGYCRPLHKLPDDELAQEISQLGGTPRAVLEDLGMRDMVLSLVRVDLKLLETRTYVDEAPLNCPITAFGSASDTRTSMDELKAWQRHTSQAFRLQEFPGGHFYFKDQDIRQRLFAEIVATLSIPEALS